MKVVVLGKNGMLGHLLYEYLSSKNNIRGNTVDVFGTDRSVFEVSPCDYQQLLLKFTATCGSDVDYVVNCIGAIKPRFNKSDPSNEIYTNGVFPHQLAKVCEALGARLIHITTDCVYSGREGGYTERSEHDPLDVYGKSKSIGESENAITLRTSIIGPEYMGRQSSFLDGFLKKYTGKTINGFQNHFWNGLTTLELSKRIYDIMYMDIENGTYHLFAEIVSKYYMAAEISHHYGLNLKINRINAPVAVDRTLNTIYDLNEQFKYKTFGRMIEELKLWENWNAQV